jgi:predicted dinucleotide-binding enzyme
MTAIGIIGVGEVGSQVARAAIANGYDVVTAKSRGPETLEDLDRDGHFPVVDSAEKTEHELRQEQSSLAVGLKRFPEAVELVTSLYDQFGFDTIDDSPLSESWRGGPGQPAWIAHEHQTKAELAANLAAATPIIRA